MIELNLAGLVNDACDEDFDPVLTPAQTYQKLVRGETEKLRFAEMAGRIAAVMLVPYPPGIPMSMPGERLGGPNTPVIKLILAMEEFGKRFPGFEREVHGIEVDCRRQLLDARRHRKRRARNQDQRRPRPAGWLPRPKEHRRKNSKETPQNARPRLLPAAQRSLTHQTRSPLHRVELFCRRYGSAESVYSPTRLSS